MRLVTPFSYRRRGNNTRINDDESYIVYRGLEPNPYAERNPSK